MRKRLTAATFTIASTFACAMGVAHAEEQNQDKALASTVMSSSNPEETFKGLSSADKQRFIETMNPEKVTQRITKPTVLSLYSTGNCKQASHHQDWKSRWGFTVATSWLDIEWCTNGNQVTDVKITNQGGETKTPGYTYTGVNNSGAKPSGDVGRAFSEIGLKLGENVPIVNQLPALTPCIKITGHADGKAEAMADVGAGNGCRDI